MCTYGGLRGKKKTSRPLYLEFEMVLRLKMWVLGTELLLSAKAASMLAIEVPI